MTRKYVLHRRNENEIDGEENDSTNLWKCGIVGDEVITDKECFENINKYKYL